MISFRKADLLDHIDKMNKNAQACRLVINMVYDRDKQRAHKVSDRYVAKLKLHMGNPSLIETLQTKVESAIGHRLGDNVYSETHENFADFGNRVAEEYRHKLYDICTDTPTVTVVSNPPSECRLELDFKVIIE